MLAKTGLLEEAAELDSRDPLAPARSHFAKPEAPSSKALYFAGHSLGLMPERVEADMQELLKDWRRFGVEGHTKGEKPWLPYHEFVAPEFAALVGAGVDEVLCMNTLTVNLHLMLTSFYKPQKGRFKILCEPNPFPSDRYAFASQARNHGFEEQEAILELPTEENGLTTNPAEVMAFLKKNKDSLALVLLGHANYLSGEAYDIPEISKFCKENNIPLGLNLAHGAGNLELRLSEWDVDFAVWCTYKYLNSGPGSLAGCFVNKKHHGNPKIPRLEGWWGHNKSTRFEMGKSFDPIPTVEAWQLSNPPILSLCAVWSSLQVFKEIGFSELLKKSQKITQYFAELLEEKAPQIEIVTPKNEGSFTRRGSMLCLKIKGVEKSQVDTLAEKGIFLDFRFPDIIRATPAALYTSFEDVWNLVENLKSLGKEKSS